ncbi:retrovirus-related Pol polyprotein from type-1 retrotransposable element R1 4 [Trichonephila clavipes]|nr:retrovirus-related Pol polyprotein from type-1 retrotransposable element R1 4 [Trichonephila clavipes]
MKIVVSSYIDVTAVGTDLQEDVSCWHLPAHDPLSDHKAIEFDIALNSNSPTNDAKQQFQKRVELSGIALPSGAVTNSFEEKINEVLFHSFPDDCENDDDDCHKEIRSDALINSNVTDDPPFTIHEINAVINKLKAYNRVTRNSFGIKSNVSFLIYKQGIVPFICYGSRIWGSTLKKKINCRFLRKFQRRILFRVISGYRTISYEAVFAISGFPPIDILIMRNNEFKRLQRGTVPIRI